MQQQPYSKHFYSLIALLQGIDSQILAEHIIALDAIRHEAEVMIRRERRILESKEARHE